MSKNTRGGYVFGALTLVCACSGQAFRGEESEGKGGESNTDVVTAPPHAGSKSSAQPGGAAGTDEQAEGGEGSNVLPNPSGGAGGAQGGGAPSGGQAVGGGAGGNLAGGTGGLGGRGGFGGGGFGGGGGDASGGAGASGSGGAGGSDGGVPFVCAWPVQEDWSQALGATNRWRLEFGDPAVDTVNRRLVLSRDDVAARNAELTGGYFVEADVTFDGGTVFTPYPYVKDVLLPSIRRSSSGTGIDLGMTQYGSSNAWSSSGWPAVTGSIAGGQRTHVTFYVKNTTTKAVAVKVAYENKVYRSSWVTSFPWAETALGMLRYVGENNSQVFAGTTDRIYVGKVNGCEKLSDAEVTAHFNQ